MEKKNEIREISLSGFWTAFKKCWYWMLIAAIIFGTIAYVYTDRFIQKKYASHVSYIINVDNAAIESVTKEIAVRSAFIDSVTHILESSTAKELFVGKLADQGFEVYEQDANGEQKLRADMLSSVSISANPKKGGVHEDLVFTFDVITRANSPDMAKALAISISENFKTVWNEIISNAGTSYFSDCYISELEKPSAAYQYEPNVTSNAVLASLIVAVAVYAVFFLISFFRRVLVNEDDLADAVNVPVLAAIPRIHGDRARKNTDAAPRVGSDKLISDEKRSFAAVEAYRHLRTNLIYSRHIEGTPIYGVISAMPHEGKSLSSANLAISFAQIGKKTVIVDCDLRRGTQHEIFGFGEDSEGLAEYLAGVHEMPALRESRVKGLSVLTAGHISPDPTGLLHSARFDALIAYLSENFDCVVFDLPPIRVVSDALILADRISGYILVAQSGVSYERDVREAVATLQTVSAPLFGAVLNGFNLKVGKNRRGFANSYYYGYRNSYYTKPVNNKGKKSENEETKA